MSVWPCFVPQGFVVVVIIIVVVVAVVVVVVAAAVVVFSKYKTPRNIANMVCGLY